MFSKILDKAGSVMTLSTARFWLVSTMAVNLLTIVFNYSYLPNHIPFFVYLMYVTSLGFWVFMFFYINILAKDYRND